MSEIERCTHCKRPLYWNDKVGAVHFNGLKYPCPKKIKKMKKTK